MQLLKRILLILFVCFVACSQNIDKKLLFATKRENVGRVSQLLSKGGNVNARDKFGWTPLMFASRNNDMAMISLLLHEGADINAKNVHGWTALMFATKEVHLKATLLLLENKADVNVKNDYGWTAMIWASAKGYLGIVKMMLENGADVNIKDNRGKTAFSHAEANGNFEIGKMLLDRGAKIIGGDNIIGSTLLTNIKKSLLVTPYKLPPKVEGRKKFTKKEMSQQSLLAYAAAGNIQEVIVLLDSGVYVDCRDDQGFTPLMHATRSKYLRMIRLLIKEGANVRAKNNDGVTILSISELYSGNFSAQTKELVAAGADR